MMFFLKVRLNLHFDDLAFRFNVNKGTVCSHKPLSFSCTSKLNVIVRSKSEKEDNGQVNLSLLLHNIYIYIYESKVLRCNKLFMHRKLGNIYHHLFA